MPELRTQPDSFYPFDPDYDPFQNFAVGLNDVFQTPVPQVDARPADPRFNSGVIQGHVARDPSSDIGKAPDGVGPAQTRPSAVGEQSPVQPVRQPQQVTNGALALAAGSAASVSVDLIPGALQQGVLRALCANLTGLLSTTAANPITVTLSTTYGRVLFQAVFVTTTAAVAIPAFWNFADIYVPFQQGLRLTITNGAGSVGNAGEVSVSAIWEH